MQGWKTYELKELVSLSKEKYNPKKETENLPCIELEHIEGETGRLLGHTNSLDQGSIKNRFKPGNVLYGKLRPYLRKFYFPNFEGVCSSEIWVLHNNEEKIHNKYLYYLVQTNRFNENANKSTGTKMPRADWSFMSEIIFPIPPLNEQQKIASILSTWDKAIELKEKLIEQKKEQKKGLMQKLLTGEVRLPGFKGEWKKIRLGTVIEECTEKTTVNNQYPVLTSSRKGIFLQEEYFSKQVASENNIGYKVVRKGDFTYRTMSDDGNFVFNQLEEYEVGIVSPAYAVFKATNINPLFLKSILNSYDFKKNILRNVQGGTRLSYKYSDLKNTVVKVPPKEEQSAIAEVIFNIENNLNLLEQELEALKQQKKGLMQLLLTGKVRVQV
ncbi:hypothetical protein BpJC4_31110 [Weizmannia acidilactici]|uniref:restriction endonuclease subunit S n=1 Tax=Weizmannia acidilactici TaxID=2607726 RepID=UPI00124EF2A5|nr:restriction endonuclease subunit S [Weizmannia acidilactici]GER68640.1 hypothetical protein BpJC4_31110 [Weizmannia acidilactici]